WIPTSGDPRRTRSTSGSRTTSFRSHQLPSARPRTYRPGSPHRRLVGTAPCAAPAVAGPVGCVRAVAAPAHCLFSTAGLLAGGVRSGLRVADPQPVPGRIERSDLAWADRLLRRCLCHSRAVTDPGLRLGLAGAADDAQGQSLLEPADLGFDAHALLPVRGRLGEPHGAEGGAR